MRDHATAAILDIRFVASGSACTPSTRKEPSKIEAGTIGLDLAKQVFQVHGVDAAGAIVLRRRLRRSEVVRFFSTLPGCLIGIEACATAHHWDRELSALGHEMRLIPPSYVKPYVRRRKTVAAGAERSARPYPLFRGNHRGQSSEERGEPSAS
jgi:hypothetical protein